MTIYIGLSTYNRLTPPWSLRDVDIVKQDLLNHFMTRKGERVMLPDYGSIIWDLLFEPHTDAIREAIEDDVREIVGKEPRVDLVSIVTEQFNNGVRLYLDLSFKPFDLSESLEVEFNRRRLEST